MDLFDFAKEDLDRRTADASRLRDRAAALAADALTAAELAEAEPDIYAASQAYAETVAWLVELKCKAQAGLGVDPDEALRAARRNSEAWAAFDEAARRSQACFRALDLARRAGEAERDARRAEQIRDTMRAALEGKCTA